MKAVYITIGLAVTAIVGYVVYRFFFVKEYSAEEVATKAAEIKASDAARTVSFAGKAPIQFDVSNLTF